QINAIRVQNNRGMESYNLLLDTGNTFYTGGNNKEEIVNNSNIFLSLMNQMNFSATVVSNSEFDNGITPLKNLSQKAGFPFLGANVVYKNVKDIPDFLKPYTIINFSSLRVGIIGLVNPNILKLNSPGTIDEIEFLPVMDVAQKYIQELKNKRVDIIIIMSSIWNTSTEIALANKFDKDINMIVSSTPHEEQFEKPIYVGSIPIIKVPRKGKYIAAMEFVIGSKNKEIISSDWKLYPINSKRLIPDDKIASIINSNMQLLEKKVLERKIGYSLVDMTYETVKEGVFGNFVCDIVLGETNADMVFINSGTLRGFNKGYITVNKLSQSIPYTNNIYTLKLKGDIIKNILEQSFENYKERGILQLAGVRLKYDLEAPAGKRVSDIKISGNDLDLNKYYNVATIEFLINGGDGYNLFKRGEEVKKLNITLNKVVFDYIKDQENVMSHIDSRMLDVANLNKEEQNMFVGRNIASEVVTFENKNHQEIKTEEKTNERTTEKNKTIERDDM
ncbi:MAG: bifunctional metallophosphatase/5'-nucleotidase, partial [Oligoflexia bacterium]|nr:bifunctional metallophosphatase/5'-nucleotidase [Oligoflexia bacterium]